MENTNNLSEKTFDNVKVIENTNYQWSVTDLEGNLIVPFGKYDWIDGFDHGLARVNSVGTDGKKWGIINEQGEEVLPVEYDNIWNFLGKDRNSTTVEKDGSKNSVWFSDLNPDLNSDDDDDNYVDYDRYNYDYDLHDWMEDTWDAMTDGMYGDMPDGFNGDFDWLG